MFYFHAYRSKLSGIGHSACRLETRLISTHVGNPNTSVGRSADAAGESARATIWNAVCNTVVLIGCDSVIASRKQHGAIGGFQTGGRNGSAIDFETDGLAVESHDRAAVARILELDTLA
jgi:hypothetical protein